MKDFDNLIIFIYSFKKKSQLIKILKNLYRKRKDLIVILLESPYEIKDISFIKTFICTYGFREVQIEAVLKILRSCRKATRQTQENG